MYQERYWKELYQLKVHVIYLELYLHDADFKDKAINIFLACTSSGSIAGWAVWREMAIIWALVIATSQVVTVIKNILPYKARIKAMSGLIHDLEDVLLRAEEKWFDVSEGRLTEEEINKLRFDIRTKKTNALKKHLGTSTLPARQKLLEKAQTAADIYIDHFYPTEANNG